MNWKIKCVFNSVFSFSILCICPFLLLRILPQELILFLENSSINLGLFLNEIILLGAIISIISFIKIFFEESSFIHLSLRLIPYGLWLASSLSFLSHGNIGNFGIIPLSFELNNENFASNNTIFDMRFFAYFFVVIIILKSIHLILEFKQKRKERTTIK